MNAPLPKPHATDDRLLAYESGVADGQECRRRGGRPSIFLRVAFDDPYSSGFMDGYTRRVRGKPRIASTAR